MLISGDHEQARVWAILVDGKSVAILKKHHVLSSARLERRSYEHIKRGRLPQVPVLLGRCPDDPRYLLMSVLHGGRLPIETAHYQAAGRWLRMLHRQSFTDTDPISISRALQMRLAAARGVLKSDVSTRRWALLGDYLADSVPDDRIWCHRDFRARNWVVTEDPSRLGIIDFGQSRPDYWLIDWVHVRLETLHEPQLWAAFVRGYGRALDEAHGRLFRGLIGLTGVASLAWAKQHGHLARQAEGWRYLACFEEMVASKMPCLPEC